MDTDILTSLRTGAQYIKLEPSAKHGGAVELENLILVLDSVQNSFNAFIEVQFHRTYKQSVKKTYDKELNKIKEETKLLVVDLEFQSGNAGISPDLIKHHFQPPYLKISDWKKEKFDEYKTEVFNSNYNSKAFIGSVNEKYTPEERNGIFRPIIDNLQNNKNYTIRFGDYKKKYEHTFYTIKDESIAKLLPKIEKEPSVKREKLYHIYGTVTDDITLFGHTKNIKKVLFAEETLPIYPHVTKEIKYEDSQIILKDNISANVEYDEEEKFFHVIYDDLGINVWGDTREEAIEAFNFAFISLYENYVDTKDKLTDKARELSKKISSLIKSVKLKP